MPIAQLLPMSDEMIASFGSAAWIARQAIRGLIRSGCAARARSFQVVPGSSSSWSIDESCLQPGRARPVHQRLALLPPGVPRRRPSAARICSATSRASPWIATLTGLVSPIRSALMSTWITFAAFGQ